MTRKLEGRQVLVTGGAGAIGSNLVKRLLDDGNRVVVLDDMSSGFRDLVDDRSLLIEGSVLDPDSLDEAFSGEPTHVFHLASLFANQNSVEHPDKDLRTNGLGTLEILRRAAESDARRLVYTSSSCVYHKSSEPPLVEDEVDPAFDTPYAATKFLGEQYVRFWGDFHGLSFAIVRLFNCYGPGEHPGRYRNVVPNFLKLAHRGEPLTITGTGEETRDFTFVEDVVEGLIQAAIVPEADRGIFNLGSGVETSIKDLAQRVNKMCSNPAGLRFAKRRQWDSCLRRQADISRARQILSFRPRTSLDEGLDRTYSWLKEQVLGPGQTSR